MGLFTGKKGIIMGVANEYSIAAAVAEFLHKEGATIGFNHLPDKEGRDRMAKRVHRVADPLGATFIRPCDVANDDDVKKFFEEVKKLVFYFICDQTSSPKLRRTNSSKAKFTKPYLI